MARRIAPILVAVAVLLLGHGRGGTAWAEHKASRGKKAGKGHGAGKAARGGPVRGTAAVPVPVPPPAAPERKAEEVRQQQRAAGKSDEERELKRGERVEFDGRLIEGQTAASGAIYLFERLPSELRSMVLERQGYRREELSTLYPNGVPPGERRAPPAAGAATAGDKTGR